MTHITDRRGDLEAESSGWLFKSALAGGGGILCRPHDRPHNLLAPGIDHKYLQRYMSKLSISCIDVDAGGREDRCRQKMVQRRQ